MGPTPQPTEATTDDGLAGDIIEEGIALAEMRKRSARRAELYVEAREAIAAYLIAYGVSETRAYAEAADILSDDLDALIEGRA